MANKTLKSLTLDDITYDLDYVLRAGDTMTDNLALKTIADASKTDNGVTSIIHPTLSRIIDAPGRQVSTVEATINPSGDISTFLIARNYDTSGALKTNASLVINARKNGTAYATLGNITKPASNTYDAQIATTAFVQDAINRRLTKTVLAGSYPAQSLAHNTQKVVDVWTATSAGTVFITILASFTANANGYRTLAIFKGGSTTGVQITLPACAAGGTVISTTGAIRVATGNKIQARLVQGSGGTLATSSGYYSGIFIPD